MSSNQRMGVLNTSGFGTQGRLSPKEQQLSELVKQQLDIDLALSQATVQMKSTEAAAARGEVPSKVSDIVDKDPEIMQLQARLNEAEILANQSVARLGDQHWQVRDMQASVRGQQQQLDRRRNEKVAAEQVRYVEALRNEAMALSENSQSVGARVDELKREMADLANQMALYLTEKDEEEYYKEKAKAIEEQLRLIAQMDLQQGVNNVNWAPGGQPLTPELPTFPKLPVTMALALFVGLALSLGIAFLRELTDTSIRSPRDVARVGQMTLLGSVPDANDDPMASGARLPLVIYDAPTSMTADQFRQIRTRLQYAASLDTTRSILVTSPSPNDGKTAVSCNLAAGLALNGRRILLVDADFRRPDLHKVFELPNDRGFSDALQNLDALEDLIHATQVPNLSVLPTGARPGNATELLESQLLVDFIERALEEYDHVIFDSGPLPLVSETIALAPRVDGVVTVVRARTNSRGLLQRVRDELRKVKAENLGVILNAVRTQAGGY
ncbi:MAG TPA: polysaccharide biosynthesis tyrosine autokinase, partial [Tepidisphaeraceae bacterium]|nr:polysaccharide biosynthesis tyrosine autokinase [Tepidisphaeraceae bacterium]